MASSDTEREDGQDWHFTAAAVAVALLPRLFVAIAWAREPVWDGHYYHFGAERIAQGLGYSEDVLAGGQTLWKPWVHYPVGYSALLGLVYKIAGSSLVVAPVVNALLSAATVAVVHRFARYSLSENRARIAAAFTALHPGLIAYTVVVMTEGLAALLLLAAGLVALRFRGIRGLLGAGALLGLATLVRPSSLLAAPLLAFTQPAPAFRALGRSAIALGVALVIVSPWTIRNCVRMDGCALVSTNGGWNLAIGALTETGRFRTLRAADGCPIVKGQVEQDRCWAKVGRDTILADPGNWLRLIPKKLGQTYDHESFAIEYLREADPAAWPEDRRTAARGLLTLFHRLLLCAAALCTVALMSVRARSGERAFGSVRQAWVIQTIALVAFCVLGAYGFADDEHPFFWLAILAPLVAMLPLPGRPEHGPAGAYALGLWAVTSLTHGIFFGDDRYHMVVTPVLCVLAAAALREPKRAAEP